MARLAFAALALLLATFPAGAAPAPLPRPAPPDKRVAIESFRAALREGHNARVTLELPVNEEFIVPPIPGKVYSLDIDTGEGLVILSTEVAPRRTVGASRSVPGTIRVTVNGEARPGSPSFTIVAEIHVVEKKVPAPRR